MRVGFEPSYADYLPPTKGFRRITGVREVVICTREVLSRWETTCYCDHGRFDVGPMVKMESHAKELHFNLVEEASKLLNLPLSDMPRFINNSHIAIREISKWRLCGWIL